MPTTTLARGDVLIADRTGRAELTGNGSSTSTIVPPRDLLGGGGFGTSPFGISGFGGGEPHAAGEATVVPAIGQATLTTT